jgi:hypothetical protein
MIRIRAKFLLIIISSLFVSTFGSRCTSNSGRIGNCVPLSECPAFHAQNFMAFPDHFCDDEMKLFCCEVRRGRLILTTTEVPENSEIDYENHPNFKLFNFDTCGQIGSSNRIANGVKVGLFELTWNAQLGYKDDDTDEIKFGCGGSLISG